MCLNSSKETLTFEQFEHIAESIKNHTGERTEYVNGKIYYMSPFLRHSRVSLNICRILEDNLPSSSCIVVPEMHIKFAENNYRIPDISVFCGSDVKAKCMDETIKYECPKLIVEILSESTEDVDRNEKMKLYANRGVEEYLIIDYKNEIIEQYVLSGDEYSQVKCYKNSDKCRLMLYPMVRFKVTKVFKLFRD